MKYTINLQDSFGSTHEFKDIEAENEIEATKIVMDTAFAQMPGRKFRLESVQLV